jgi:2-phosphoglycerate kinase
MPDTSVPPRSWQVLLLGGASGAGKTAVSYRLARHFDIALTEVDDFQVMLECMTTPEQQPALHYWRTHPEAADLPAEQIMKLQIAIGEAMLPGLAAVIANHLESAAPVVLEGDFILPALLAHPSLTDLAPAGAVRAIFVSEPDEAQLVENYLQREPQHGPQHGRARVSWLYSRWLEQEAPRYGAAVVPARPWGTVLERIIAALR